MSYLKNSLWMLPIMLGVAMLWVVSACANWYFGLSLGNNDPFKMVFFTTTTAELFSHASLASDLIKSAALFGVFAAFANYRKGAGSALLLAFTCCTAWSIASAVGFVSLNYSSMTDNRGKSAVDWAQLEKQISRLEERRKQVVAARPENVVKSEIDGILRTPGINGCMQIDGPVTRTLCPQFDTLKAELENAKSASWLDGRLAELRSELKGTPRVTSEDPRADMYAKITGKVSEDMAVWLALFFALMIELLTATGFWAAWTAFGAASAQPVPAEVPQEPVKAVEVKPQRGNGLISHLTPEQLKALTEWQEPCGPLLGKPVPEDPSPEPDGNGTPKAEEPKPEDAEHSPEVKEPEPTTVVNFPNSKPQSKREKARLKKERIERENRNLVEAFVTDRLDTDAPRAQIELTDKGGWRAGGTVGDDIYQEFRRYCKQRSIPAMGRNHMGRFIGEFVDRAKNSKGTVYGAVIRAEVKRRKAA